MKLCNNRSSISNQSSRPLLIVEHLTAGYTSTKDAHPPTVQDVSLTVAAGELVALLGLNGAGKSTVLKAIMRQPQLAQITGVVRLGDTVVSGLPTHRICQLGIAFVPQSGEVFPSLSVRENLSVGNPRHMVRQQEQHMFTLFPSLKEHVGQLASTLSGGERKMLGLARALMKSPRVLLLDEPSSGLAESVLQEVCDLLLHLKREGMAVLLVEQKVRIALQLAERAIILKRGSIDHQIEDPMTQDTSTQGLSRLFFSPSESSTQEVRASNY